MHRVVITGIGVISGLGLDRHQFWTSLIEGRSGIGEFEQPEYGPIRFKNAAFVRGFSPESYFLDKSVAFMDRFAQFSVVAAREAVAQSGVEWTEELREGTAIITGSCIGGRIAGVRNRVPTYHQPRERQNPTLMLIDAAISRLGGYTHMIACAKSVAATYSRKGPAYARLAVVTNGQKAPRRYSRDQARAALDLRPEDNVIGQIGRLDYQKNQGFTLDLLNDLPGVTLLLVGSGPDEPAVKNKIAASGLTGRVRLVDSIDHARIGLFYSAVDAVLFPSRFEGLSLAAIEAIHAGVPPVCADIPSFREMFADSAFLTANLLLPGSDRNAWLIRIRDILSDRELREQIAAELALLSPAYGFDTMARQYLRLIEESAA